MDVPLKYLDLGAMIAITGHWIADPAFSAIPQLKPMLPDVEAVHAALVASKPATAAGGDASLADLRVELKTADVRHDHALRAPYYLLLAAEERALSLDPPDIEEAAALADARARLFPEGVGGTRATYLAEAGNGERAAQEVGGDADLKKLLGSVGLDKKTSGADLVAAYVALAAEVGTLERQKVAAEGAAEAVATPASFAAARNDWIDLVQTVVRVLGRVKGEAARELRRGVVEPARKAAAAAAAAAKAAKKAKSAPAKGDAPSP